VKTVKEATIRKVKGGRERGRKGEREGKVVGREGEEGREGGKGEGRKEEREGKVGRDGRKGK
jgi:hypothetical protein